MTPHALHSVHAVQCASTRATAPCCHSASRKEGAMLIEHVLYRAQVKATSGRDGRAVSSDGVLDVQLTTPRTLGGAGGMVSTRSSCLPLGMRRAS